MLISIHCFLDENKYLPPFLGRVGVGLFLQGGPGWVSPVTLMSPLTPFSGGCKPSVYRRSDTLAPLNAKNPSKHNSSHTLPDRAYGYCYNRLWD